MKTTFADLVERELRVARQEYDPFDNPHHAYAVILEELESFRLQVFKAKCHRDPFIMAQELIQVAAMARRAAEDLLPELFKEFVPDQANDTAATSPSSPPAEKGGAS